MNSHKKAPKPAQGSKMSAVLGATLRWGLAIGLIVILVRSGKLSLSDLAWFREKPFKAGLFWFIELMVASIACFRWWVLLSALNLKLKLPVAIKLGFVGSFFSTILPGTVSGDLVKAVYVTKRFPSRGSRAVATMMIDRISGLYAVILLGTVAYLAGFFHLRSLDGQTAHYIMAFGLSISLVGVAMTGALLSFPFFANKLPHHFPHKLKKMPKVEVFEQFYLAILDYRKQPFILWASAGLSVVIQLTNMGLLYFIAREVHGVGPWGTLGIASFVLSSILGICAMQIPLTPMGLGIGQAAFQTTFYALGAPSATFGSPLITSLQIIQICVNLTGAIFFATYRHEVEDSIEMQSSTADVTG